MLIGNTFEIVYFVKRKRRYSTKSSRTARPVYGQWSIVITQNILRTKKEARFARLYFGQIFLKDLVLCNINPSM